jgi:hypothetical protein
MFTDACMMPYIHYGDVAQCWLKGRTTTTTALQPTNVSSQPCVPQ